MKRILYSLLVCLAVVCFSSCEDETSQDTSKITYYIDLQRLGDGTIFCPKGSTYTEPGYMATSDGEDVTSDVLVTGSVDSSTPGVYTLTYSAVNEDGFAKTFTRTIMVYDSTESPIESGFYTVSAASYRANLTSGVNTVYNSEFELTVFQVSPGVFYISDFLGGYYDQRAGYGVKYAMTGQFKLNADNTIEALSSSVAGWGDSMDAFTNGKYDPEAKSIFWAVQYATNYVFNVTMTK